MSTTHRSFHNHSSPNYQYVNHQQQQRGYNSHNAPTRPNYHLGNHQQQLRGYNVPRRPNYPSSTPHHNVRNNPQGNYWSLVVRNYFARQFWDQYQTPVFQHPYYPMQYYEQIDDVYVATDPTELIETSQNYVNFMTSQLFVQEGNSRFDFRAMYDDVSYHDHEEKEEEDDDVLKYLKIRSHHAPAKDGVDPEVVAADVDSETCPICQSEYEHEENIGALQCGHEYHTDCIKEWLLKKKDCPMCRASVLPSAE